MMENQPSLHGEGGGKDPFTISTITYKVEVYAPAERADTFFSTPIYVLCSSVGYPAA